MGCCSVISNECDEYLVNVTVFSIDVASNDKLAVYMSQL